MSQAPAVATPARRYSRIRNAAKSADSAMTARAVATTSLTAKMRLIELTEFFSLSARPHRLKPIQARCPPSYFLNAKPSRCRSTTIESARRSARNFGFRAVQAHFALTMDDG
jgi:hypothetical protein